MTWCPNRALCLLSVALDSLVVLLNPRVGDRLVSDQTDELVGKAPLEKQDESAPDRVKSAVTWSLPDRKRKSERLPPEALVELRFFRTVKQVTWHAKGDYFATVLSDAQNRSVMINQVGHGMIGEIKTRPILVISASLF